MLRAFDKAPVFSSKMDNQVILLQRTSIWLVDRILTDLV